MAKNETVLKIRAEIENLQGLNRLKSAIRKASAEAKGADNDFRALVGKVKELQAASVRSVNNLNAQKDAFQALRRSVDLSSKEYKEIGNEINKIDNELKEAQGTIVSYSKNSINALRAQKKELLAVRDSADLMSKEFKEAGVELAKLDKRLAKAEGRSRGRGGGRLAGAAQTVGTVAGAGVFGGPEGAIGAVLGAFTGPQGAIVGGAIGAQVGQLRQAAGASAEYAAELEKLRIALFGVTTSQDEYYQALDIINKATKDFAIPQDILTRQFTRLQASVQGAGGNVEDTKKAFEGIVAAVRATGGSLSDVQGALTATAQVFSKGKVSAEELRQQIGERLPGAFTLFAQAIDKTPQELDKALEDGNVSLQDFMTFAESLFERYGKTAQIIADGPDAAGDRLKVALGEMNESVGRLLKPIGASFQDTFTEIIKLIDAAARRLNIFFGIGVEGLDNKVKNLVKRLGEAQDRLRETPKPQGTAAERDAQGNLKVLTSYSILENTVKQLERELLKARDELSIAIEEQERSNIIQQTGGDGLAGGKDGDGGGKDGDGGGSTRDPLAEAKRLAAQQFRGLEAGFAEAARLKLAKQLSEIELKIISAQENGNKLAAFNLSQEAELLKVKLNIEGLERQIYLRQEQIQKVASQGIDVSTYELALDKDRNSLIIAELELNETLARQKKDRVLYEEQITKELKKQSDALNKELMDRRFNLGLISTKDYNQDLLRRERERLAETDLPAEDQARALDLYRQEIDPTFTEGITQNIGRLRQELEELLDPINQVTGAANAIGTAFTDSFMSAITGSATAQEALANFFSNTAKYFLDMAAQIIQKMITMAILNQVVGLLPGGNVGGGGGGDIFSDIAARGGLRMKNGGAFNKGGLVPFAMGGIVDKPTMFAYANGGVGRFGIMGEAGPEAILPLQRGSDGKLGVQASGGGGVSVGNINITVENSGDQLSPAAQKQLAGQVQGIVLSTLANERRSGGML